MLPTQPNQSLMDGLACLQALAVHREPIGTRELARLLGMQPVRVNRLLKTLAYLGLAEQDERRKYRPGPGIHVLAAYSLHGSGLLSRALGPLESLRSLGHYVALAVLWRDQTCYLYHAGPGATIDHSVAPPFATPAAVSGLGLALLAQKPEPEIKELYAEPDRLSLLSAAWQPPILEGDDGLLARLARIREQGYAMVPFPDTGNRTLAVCLGQATHIAIGLSGKFPNHHKGKLLDALREAVGKIEATEDASSR